MPWSETWERKMIRTVFALAGLASALLTAPVLAHHAFAIFDSSKLVYTTGTVKQFELVNPAHLASCHHRQRQGRRIDMVLRGRLGLAVGAPRLVQRYLQGRRQGRGWLSSHEGRFARRPADERQADERAEAMLQPRLRRRHRRISSSSDARKRQPGWGFCERG